MEEWSSALKGNFRLFLLQSIRFRTIKDGENFQRFTVGDETRKGRTLEQPFLKDLFVKWALEKLVSVQ